MTDSSLPVYDSTSAVFASPKDSRDERVMVMTWSFPWRFWGNWPYFYFNNVRICEERLGEYPKMPRTPDVRVPNAQSGGLGRHSWEDWKCAVWDGCRASSVHCDFAGSKVKQLQARRLIGSSSPSIRQLALKTFHISCYTKVACNPCLPKGYC